MGVARQAAGRGCTRLGLGRGAWDEDEAHLDLPCMILVRVELEVICDLNRRERALDVLLVRHHQQRRTAQILCAPHRGVDVPLRLHRVGLRADNLGADDALLNGVGVSKDVVSSGVVVFISLVWRSSGSGVEAMAARPGFCHLGMFCAASVHIEAMMKPLLAVHEGGIDRCADG